MTHKLSTCETFFALLKGYCAVGIIYAPKAFQNGGFIFSPIVLIISGILSTICAIKLINVGKERKIFNYGLIVERVFGARAKIYLDIMIAST